MSHQDLVAGVDRLELDEAWAARTIAELGQLTLAEPPATVEIAVGPLEGFLMVSAIQAILADPAYRMPPQLRQLLTRRGLGVEARLPELAQSALDAVWVDIPSYCRLCGCVDERACPGGCRWVEDPEGLGDLCSACLPKVTT